MAREKKITEVSPGYGRRLTIKKEYFSIFQTEFAQRVLARIPAVSSVSFLIEEKDVVELSEQFGNPALVSLWNQLIEGNAFYGIEKDVLLFTLPGESPFVVCLSGAAPIFLRRMDEGWLQEVAQSIVDDLYLVISGGIDCITDLPNLARLQSLLEDWQREMGGCLTLVELPCRSKSASEKYRYLQFCSRALKNFTQNPVYVHYLGQEIFALIFPLADDKKQEFADFENRLIAFLKKEGCFRVHVGATLWLPQYEEENGSVFFDQAWSALQYAEKRGPFSFCNYHHLAYPEEGQLTPASNSLQSRLRKRWGDLSRFSLLLIKVDSHGELSAAVYGLLNEEPCFFQDGEEHYLLFPDDDGQKAQRKMEELIAFGKELGADSFSGGIAVFPYSDFKKSEMVMNCKKALIHASFLGPSSVAVFNQVSLNISGDIYFAEGDFIRAISEYRRGIICDGGEVNLYNSLGVTLALMNRLRPALDSFAAALALDGSNFMALYNSGLVLKDMGQLKDAFSMFEQAYNCTAVEEDDSSVMQDIELYLGMLGVETEQMESAVHYLSRWFTHCGQQKESGKVYRYLGLAYNGVGDEKRAVEFLQKALHYDQFDAQALSLLGYLYLKTGEGADVACTLCRKSVELEPDNIAFLLYYAESLIACGKYDQGRSYLLRCQRNKDFCFQAWLLLGELYLLQGKKSLSRKYFGKLSGKHGLSADIKQRVQRGIKHSQ